MRVAEEHDSVASLIASVESGAGVAVVTDSLECVTGARLKFIRLSPEPKPLVLGAVWGKDELSPAAGKFLECAKRVAGELRRDA
jgi:DNA-binding transcriptional LysR family regulator